MGYSPGVVKSQTLLSDRVHAHTHTHTHTYTHTHTQVDSFSPPPPKMSPIKLSPTGLPDFFPLS